MANMSYCRFQNTLRDLRDCYESDDMWDGEDLSDEEKRARLALIRLCAEIASDLGGESD